MPEKEYNLHKKSEIYRPYLDEFIDRIEGGGLAKGLVLFGSSARGEAKPDSDLDVLTVTDRDWYSRMPDFARVLREVRDTIAYKSLEKQGVAPQIYPFFVEVPQLDNPPLIMCEIVNHGVILFDPVSLVSNKFASLRNQLDRSERVVAPDGRIIWQKLPMQGENAFKKSVQDRLTLLYTAVEESLEEARFSFDRGVYNLAIRRSQEAVELALTKMLLEMGVDAPKDHDKGETVFETLAAQGISADPEVEARVKEIAIVLTRMRGHSMHQTIGYGRSVANEALSRARYIKEFTDAFSLTYREMILVPRILTICGSMCKLIEMRVSKEKLERVPNWIVIIPEAWTEECEVKIKQGEYRDTADMKLRFNSVKTHHDEIARSDWVLIHNLPKNGNKGYIGGNTFWEVGFAHVLGKPIYMLHDYRDNTQVLDELDAVGIVVLDGNLDRMINYMEEENRKRRPIDK